MPITEDPLERINDHFKDMTQEDYAEIALIAGLGDVDPFRGARIRVHAGADHQNIIAIRALNDQT